MDTSSQFRPISISSEKDLSVPFLIDWILAVILCILVPFYFGRIFAWVITLMLDIWSWRRYKVKITLQSVKISFLGGRVFFKNLTIVTKDYTISFLEGSFTWRYWLLHTRVSSIQLSQEEAKIKENEKLPPRFLLQCDGFEMFVYNKLDTYESIVREHFSGENCKRDSKQSDEETDDNEAETSGSFEESENTKSYNDPNIAMASKLPASHRIFPIQLKINKGAVVIGNSNTKQVGIFSFEQGKGTLDISSASSDLDLYKKRASLDLTDCVFEIKSNLGFHNNNPIKSFVVERRLEKIWKFTKRQLLKIYRNIFKEQRPTSNQHASYLESWSGLNIYQHSKNQQNHVTISELQNHEYARYSTLLKSKGISLTYTYDIPGLVPNSSVYNNSDSSPNHEPDPEFGVEISLSNAAIYYGPWAQKHIQELQRMFSPIVLRDHQQPHRLKPGSKRTYSNFTTSIHISDISVLHIPTREPSKDVEFLERHQNSGDTQRAFGWFNITLKPDSEFSLKTALFASKNRIGNKLYLKLIEPIIKSSVNHEILFTAKSHCISADVGYPLGWNQKNVWKFDFSSESVELFLLKDHVILLTDLINDFGSDQPVNYEQFHPITYNFNWKIDDYKIFLNVNDANIINNPLDFSENCYLSLEGDLLNVKFSLPFNTISKTSHEFPFEINSPLIKLCIHSPTWNTLHEFLKEPEFGRCPDFSLTGSYLSHSVVDIDNTDTITINITSSSTTFVCYGFVLRYIMIIKLNYFGDFKHFKTTEEYSSELSKKYDPETINNDKFSTDTDDLLSSSSSSSLPSLDEFDEFMNEKVIQKSSLVRVTNEIDVWVTFCVDDGRIVIPQNVYDCDSSFSLYFDRLDFDIRYTNYYMDLSAAFSMISIISDDEFEYSSNSQNDLNTTSVKGTLDDFSLHGHRMFGLPPTEETYLCKWNIGFSSLETNSNFEFLLSVWYSLQKIAFTYHDAENILIYDIIKPVDVTILTVFVDAIKIKIHEDSAGENFCVNLNDISLQLFDVANDQYSKRIDAAIPSIKLFVADKENVVLSHLSTSLDFSNFVINRNSRSHVVAQRKCLLLNDAPFHRCGFLLPLQIRDIPFYQHLHSAIIPSISIPVLAEPLTETTFDSIFEDILGSYSEELSYDTDTQDPKKLIADALVTSTHSGVRSGIVIGLNSYSNKSKFETDNLSVILGLTKIFITTKIIPVIYDIFKSLSKLSVSDVMDHYEMDIVSKFSKYYKEKSAVTNISFYTCTVCITVSSDYDPRSNIIEHDHISITLSHISLLSKATKTYEYDQNDFFSGIEYDSESVVALKILKIEMDLFQKTKNRLAKQVPISCLIAENVSAIICSDEDNIIKLNLGSIKFLLKDEEIKWMLNYFSLLKSESESYLEKLCKLPSLRKRKSKEILFRIAESGEQYGIDHVPHAVTKPAYITRLSPHHVRDNSSWRIITRLRHAVNYFPSEWFDDVRSISQNDSLTDEKSTKEGFLEIFKKWRNWDLSEVAGCYLYRKVFLELNLEKSASVCTEFHVSTESFIIDLRSNQKSNMLSLTNAHIAAKSIISEEILDFDILGESEFEMDLAISLTNAEIILNEELLSFMIEIQDLVTHKVTDKSKIRAASVKQFSFYLKELTIKLDFFQSTLLFKSERLSISSLLTVVESNSQISASYSSAFLSAQFSHLNDPVLFLNIQGISGNFEHESTNALNVVSIVANELYCDSYQTSAYKARKIIDATKQDLEKVKMPFSLFEKQSQSFSESTKALSTFQSIFSLGIVRVKTYLLAPFKFDLTTNKLNIMLDVSTISTVNIKFADILIDVELRDLLLLRLFISNTILKYKDGVESNEVEVDIDATKLTLFDVNKRINIIIEGLNQASSNISQLDFNSPSSCKYDCQKTNGSVPWSVKVNTIYTGLMLELDSSKFVTEINNGSFSFSEKLPQLSSNKIFEFNCRFSAENLCFLIIDARVPLEKSTLLDVGLSLMLSKEDGKKSLQLESSHARIALSPITVAKSIWLFNEMKIAIQTINGNGLFMRSLESSTNLSDTPSLSVHILSYNLCIGWLFDSKSSEHGLIWGYERLFAAYEQPFGKLTIVDGYFATAQGGSSNDFYLSGNIPEYNRSHLPSMQLNYWFKDEEKMQDLYVRMNASRLDVRLLTNAVDIAKAVIQSIHNFQEEKSNITYSEPYVIPGPEEKVDSPVSSFTFPEIRSVNCVLNYEGGIIKLFTNEDFLNGNNAPSFELISPSIAVSMDYMHDKLAKKCHIFRSTVNVESTHNTIYPSCVPVLASLVHDVQTLIDSINMPKKDISVKSPLESKTNLNISSLNYNDLLKDLDIALVINIRDQNITLTCEPKAKIQADIGFQEFKIAMFTNNSAIEEPLSVSLTWSGIEITSRHIFSREVSGSAGIDVIFIDLILTHENNIKTYGQTLISDTKLYLNMKQLQDINLLIDIWSLTGSSKPATSELIADKAYAKKAAAEPFDTVRNNDIPWVYALIFKDISATIDMGPSLGSLKLTTPTFWILSRHEINWSHSLTFNVDNIQSEAKGRLGGELSISNIMFDSSISWPILDQKFQFPLIKLSLSVDYIKVKLSFDFHSFLIGEATKLDFSLHNERDTTGLLNDLLAVSASCGSIDVFLTALASANLYDIYDTFSRMRLENKKSYVQILKESNPHSSGKVDNKSTELLEPLRLRTNLSAEVGSFRLHVYPSALFDREVLVLKAKKMNVEATTQTEQKTKTDLTWQIHDINVSLAKFKNDMTEESFVSLSIDDYINQAVAVNGGVILAAPSVFVGITTWQKIPDNTIELLYSSSFGDKVDIKWNLDPINFIREMWATHVGALSVRRAHDGLVSSKTFFEDENIAEKIKVVDLGTKYIYVPLDEPHIEMPLLKDLGDATPPIEWFGVNRKRFPGMTHQLVVIPLQKLIHLAEHQYNRILGENLSNM